MIHHLIVIPIVVFRVLVSGSVTGDCHHFTGNPTF